MMSFNEDREIVEMSVPDEGTDAGTFLALVVVDHVDPEETVWPWPETWPVQSG